MYISRKRTGILWRCGCEEVLGNVAEGIPSGGGFGGCTIFEVAVTLHELDAVLLEVEAFGGEVEEDCGGDRIYGMVVEGKVFVLEVGEGEWGLEGEGLCLVVGVEEFEDLAAPIEAGVGCEPKEEFGLDEGGDGAGSVECQEAAVLVGGGGKGEPVKFSFGIHGW